MRRRTYSAILLRYFSNGVDLQCVGNNRQDFGLLEVGVLAKQIKGKSLIIWDGLPAHRSRVVKNYVESQDGNIVLERLRAYAPELNPAEYIWGYMKQRQLANLCLTSIHEVGAFARNRLKSMQRRPQLISAFWKQAELPI